MSESNWLYSLLQDAVRRKLCTKMICTTCGARDFRKELHGAILSRYVGSLTDPHAYRQHVVSEITKALKNLVPDFSEARAFTPAVRCLLFDIWRPSTRDEIEAQLAGSWAGRILAGMKDHYAAVVARRRAHEEMQDPINVQRRREEKKRLRQEKHQERLRLKKKRDALWRKNHEAD